MTSEGRLLENAPCSGRPVVLLCAGLQLVGEAPHIGGSSPLSSELTDVSLMQKHPPG